jgi:hypothetical protein
MNTSTLTARHLPMLFSGQTFKGCPIPLPPRACWSGKRIRPDGRTYLTIEQAARRFHHSAAILRTLFISTWSDVLPDWMLAELGISDERGEGRAAT